MVTQAFTCQNPLLGFQFAHCEKWCRNGFIIHGSLSKMCPFYLQNALERFAKKLNYFYFLIQLKYEFQLSLFVMMGLFSPLKLDNKHGIHCMFLHLLADFLIYLVGVQFSHPCSVLLWRLWDTIRLDELDNLTFPYSTFKLFKFKLAVLKQETSYIHLL